MTRTAKASTKTEDAAAVAAHREKIRAEIWSKIPGGRPVELDEPEAPKKHYSRRIRGVTSEIFYAHKEPGIIANPKSAAYKDGYETKQGGGWWRGCPHCHDTQEFADWQAGWHKAYYESRA